MTHVMRWRTFFQAATVVVVMAVVGVLVTVGLRAATVAVEIEAEAGTLQNGAEQVGDVAASGGQAVRFVASQSGQTRACPPPPAYPDGQCTGLLPGVPRTVVTGDKTYSSTTGQVVENIEFRGIVYVTGANITFKNCLFRGRANTGSYVGLFNTTDSSGQITVMDSEVSPEFPSVQNDGMQLKNTLAKRVNVHGTVDGIKTYGNVTIEDSYIHNLVWYANDPSHGGTPSHNDGVQSWGNSTLTILQHNRIDLSATRDGNAAWQSSALESVAVDNWFDGGGCTLNFEAAPNRNRELKATIRNNRFGRHQGFANCAVYTNGNPAAIYESLHNVWDDNGQLAYQDVRP